MYCGAALRWLAAVRPTETDSQEAWGKRIDFTFASTPREGGPIFDQENDLNGNTSHTDRIHRIPINPRSFVTAKVPSDLQKD
ncbi:uncharacterized protein SPSK_03777 [Sporothrix schenckii 1099-18]|uniref:Uncharacterized protein n=1 Tax=Sporothrix schenckii 1099-18 TaxID=1397361 RepID=A0A0F2LXP4_SPOSC|nr:uncharacterized protein SPSK_03777 [Sporothrix schenckii 1099-18]KJR82237.1 hypothetical protein SPSK_03777 [Sporothrix schenckii 1099-18]